MVYSLYSEFNVFNPTSSVICENQKVSNMLWVKIIYGKDNYINILYTGILLSMK
jgi:hypothetical protein